LNAAKGAADHRRSDMKYLLAFVRDQDRMYEGTEEEMKAAMEAWNAFDREAIDAGVLIANEALELPKTARTVRFEESGQPSVTDGPFAETKEQLGGFIVLEASDLNHAIQLISAHPGVRIGPFEIRAVEDMTEAVRESARRRSAASEKM
jgi:hypothetical protein